MDMKKREFLTAGLGVVGGLAAAGLGTGVDPYAQCIKM